MMADEVKQELLLTPDRAIKLLEELRDGCGTEMAEYIVACNDGLRALEVLKHRIERPELKKEIQNILDTAITVGNDCREISKVDQILALKPTEEEIRKDERERIIAWGNEVCTSFDHSSPYIKGRLRKNCDRCWQALKGNKDGRG